MIHNKVFGEECFFVTVLAKQEHVPIPQLRFRPKPSSQKRRYVHRYEPDTLLTLSHRHNLHLLLETIRIGTLSIDI